MQLLAACKARGMMSFLPSASEKRSSPATYFETPKRHRRQPTRMNFIEQINPDMIVEVRSARNRPLMHGGTLTGHRFRRRAKRIHPDISVDTMQPDQASVCTQVSRSPFHVFVIHQYREGATVTGASGDGAQYWLIKYNRIAMYNERSNETPLSDVPYYLSNAALNKKEIKLSTRYIFKIELIAVFGSRQNLRWSATSR